MCGDSHDHSSSMTINLQICLVFVLSILAPGQIIKEFSIQGFSPRPSTFGKPTLKELSIISSKSPFSRFLCFTMSDILFCKSKSSESLRFSSSPKFII